MGMSTPPRCDHTSSDSLSFSLRQPFRPRQRRDRRLSSLFSAISIRNVSLKTTVLVRVDHEQVRSDDVFTSGVVHCLKINGDTLHKSCEFEPGSIHRQ